MKFIFEACEAHNVSMGLIIIMSVLLPMLAVWRMIWKGGPKSGLTLVLPLLVLPLAMLAFERTSDISPNIIVFFVEMLECYLLARLFWEDLSESDARILILAVVSLSLLAPTIKLSSSVISVACLCFLVPYLTIKKEIVLVRLTLAIGVMAFLFIIMPWGLRGVILSGWPAFPVAFGQIHVPWVVPVDKVLNQSLVIRAWARCPYMDAGEVMASGAWLKPWLTRAYQTFFFEVGLPASIGILTLTGWFVVSRIYGRCVVGARSAVLILPALSGAIFWFCSAPSPWFTGVTLWWLASASLALLLLCLENNNKNGLVSRCYAVVCVVGVLALFCGRELLLDQGSPDGFYPIKEAEVKAVSSESGLVVYVPVDGDQCWNAPLPCTPYPHKGLRLRGETLSQGFILDRNIAK